jgi:hypothetical protein
VFRIEGRATQGVLIFFGPASDVISWLAFSTLRSTSTRLCLRLDSGGYPELDKLLGREGYPDRSAVLTIGPPGIGKEALGYKFTYGSTQPGAIRGWWVARRA